MGLEVSNQILTVTVRSCPPAIENPESEEPLSTDKVPVPFDDAGGDGGRPTMDEVQGFCGSWKADSHFTPPGPAVCFDESQSGVQRPLPFPSEAECIKLFLTEELVGDIIKTNRYAWELQEKREPGVGGTTTISEMHTFLVTVEIAKKNSLREYWSTVPKFATPFFSTPFSQDCFLVLLR
jgi:hypothetical protein